MSRHEIAATRPEHHQVFVGWDVPLVTYFFQVYDRGNLALARAAEAELLTLTPGQDRDRENKLYLVIDQNDGPVCWRGATAAEIATIDKLAEALAPYAVLTPEMVQTLTQERLTGGDPTPMQQAMRELLSRRK